MTWETPKTWSAEGITDDKLNEQLRDNMNALKAPPTANYSPSYAAGDLTSTSSATFVNIHASLVLSITTKGGDVLVCLNGLIRNVANIDIAVNGMRQGGNDGILGLADEKNICLLWLLTDMAAATYEIAAQWKTSSSTQFSAQSLPQMWIREVS